MNEYPEIGLQNSTVVVQKLTIDNNYQVFAFTFYQVFAFTFYQVFAFTFYQVFSFTFYHTTSTFTTVQHSVFLTPSVFT